MNADVEHSKSYIQRMSNNVRAFHDSNESLLDSRCFSNKLVSYRRHNEDMNEESEEIYKNLKIFVEVRLRLIDDDVDEKSTLMHNFDKNIRRSIEQLLKLDHLTLLMKMKIKKE